MTTGRPASDPYAAALLSMIRGITNRQASEYGSAAESMEMLVEAGDIPVNLEYYATMYSALCYDIAGFPGRAEGMYGRMRDVYKDELEFIVPSKSHAKKLAAGLSMLGLRRTRAFSAALSDAIAWIKRVESETGRPVAGDRADDYNVMLSSMILLDDFFTALTGSGEGDATGRLAHEASEQYDELPAFDLSPQVGFVARLYLQLIRASSERAVATLNIGDAEKRGLLQSTKYELWPPQKKAVDTGLLNGQSVVCAAPPGSGKSLLAHLALAGANRGRRGIAAYLVPTTSLSRQVGREVEGAFGGRMRVAVSNRDAADGDDLLRELDIVVATYEKMDALLRRNKIGPEDIGIVIVDEVHGVADKWRGMDLEMLLTRLRTADLPDSQFVALSAVASEGDTQRLAKWLSARPVVDDWRPVRINESICLDGLLYSRNGGSPERLPETFLPSNGAKSPEKRMRECFAFVRKSLVDGGSVLISVDGASVAHNVALGIKDMMERAASLDRDLADAIKHGKREWEEAAAAIEGIEARVPPHAAGLADVLRSGIAWHHAGLGSAYRAAVEGAAERGQIRIVVAASAPDAVIDAPFGTVVFYDPLSQAGSGDGGGGGGEGPRLDATKYRSIAGRAGRGGHGNTCESILLAMSEGDAGEVKEGLWNCDGGGGRLRSALGDALGCKGKAGEGRDRLHSHILEIICEKNGSTVDGIVERLRSSWFCHSEPPDEAGLSSIAACVSEGVGRLESLGLVSANDGGVYEATPAGTGANGSMLLPESFSMIRRGIGRLARSDLDDGDLEAALLILAASPAEVFGRYSGAAAGVVVPERLARLQVVLGDYGARSGALGGGARLATILQCWVGSMPLEEIIGRCRIGEPHAADIGDGLAADAAWVLSTAAVIAREMPEVDGRLAGMLDAAAASCRLGTADPRIRDLVGARLPGMGRETSIRLAAHLRAAGKRLEDASGPEISALFAENPAGAARLCVGLENAGLIGRAAPAPVAQGGAG